MNHYLKPLIDTMTQHPHIGLLITFVIAFAESLPIIGTIIPGSVTMTAIGTLIGTGVLPPLSTILAATFGALVGDYLGFLAGFFYSARLQAARWMQRFNHWIEPCEAFFKRHGGKSVIIGRFFGPARSTVPLVAGLLKMPPVRFTAAVIPSAFMWAAIYLLPGVMLGRLTNQLPAHLSTSLALLLIMTLLLIVSIIWGLLRLVRAIQPRLSSITTLVQHKLAKITHKNHTVLTPALIAHEGRLLAGMVTALILIMMMGLSATQPIMSLNHVITQWTLTDRSHWGMICSAALSHFFTPLHSISMAAGLSMILFISKQPRAAVQLLVRCALCALVVVLLKIVYFSARPGGIQFIKSSSSFPSGHVALCLSLLWPSYWGKHRYWLIFSSGIVVCALGWSRIYLGDHWLWDVLGGGVCAISCRQLAEYLIGRLAQSPAHKPCGSKWLLTAAPLVFLLNGMTTVSGINPLAESKQLTAQAQAVPLVSQPAVALARMLVDQSHLQSTHPLNLVYQGEANYLVKKLQAVGWQTISWDLLVQQIFAALHGQRHQFLFYPFYRLNYRKPQIMMVHLTAPARIIVLWPHNTTQEKALWLGSLHWLGRPDNDEHIDSNDLPHPSIVHGVVLSRQSAAD